MLKTHHCGTLRPQHIGETVTVCGWVNRIRDHGGVVFIDLRDRSGVVQCVFDPQDCPHEVVAAAREVGNEWVLKITGVVARRPLGTENPRLPTGDIEVRGRALEVLNPAKPLPFPVTADEMTVDEWVRLKHRYLDLRRKRMRDILELRHRFVKAVRDFMDENGFWEIETPLLWKHTPEGAREFLVPSRLHAGKFFVLPQSPQIAKQLLMVAGVERYFQIARCLRDEDPRADRQPEFTQIDIEMSFVTADDIYDLVERMLQYALEKAADIKVTIPFPRITYADAMERYGSDKPDLRFGMELADITDIVAQSAFRVFAETAAKGGQVKALRVPNMATASRKDIADLTEFAKRYGAKGLATFALGDGEIRSQVAKFLTDGELRAIFERCGAQTGDLVLVVADEPEVVAAVLGNLRLKLGRQLGLVPSDGQSAWRFVWVVDFPLLQWDADERRYTPSHHPFTSPYPDDLPLLQEGAAALSDPNYPVPKGHRDHPLGKVRAYAYDIVLNGYEIGGGSIRIHRREVQELVFRAIELPPEEARRKFGFLLDAFEFGAPPHGGIALGLDRIIALLAGCEATAPETGLPYLNIREVIAFPKTSTMQDPLTGAPTPVDEKVLAEQHIALRPEALEALQREPTTDDALAGQ
ncbi:Aspartate--tRNA ligase [bacterium HR17]|uniref:Aspartate--tRNA(Asp/Asn) ligase n=1 Tax=Candidatus Fervidibacter japonicus TaxID=2035412 RepID=A0A2H5XB04_9BACT|nr:Aspartate--tRNA ligase [bacterium HR17]